MTLPFLVEEARSTSSSQISLEPAKPRRFSSPVSSYGRDLGELAHADQADADTGVAVLLLEAVGELAVGLVGHDRQLSDATIGAHARSRLVLTGRRRPRPMVWRRSVCFAHLAQGADLEDVRVVPALAQRGVAEDEPHRLALVEQLRLVAHDQLVGVVVGRS